MFTGIKEEDFVIAHINFGATHRYILCKVTKVNKKTFEVDKYPSKTFTIDYGSVYGNKYGLSNIAIMKYDAEFYAKKVEEQKQNEKRKDLLSKIGGIDYKNLTNEQLERIVSVVEG